jgi:hypothetical protein
MAMDSDEYDVLSVNQVFVLNSVLRSQHKPKHLCDGVRTVFDSWIGGSDRLKCEFQELFAGSSWELRAVPKHRFKRGNRRPLDQAEVKGNVF